MRKRCRICGRRTTRSGRCQSVRNIPSRAWLCVSVFKLSETERDRVWWVDASEAEFIVPAGHKLGLGNHSHLPQDEPQGAAAVTPRTERGTQQEGGNA
jgi:hypothetical protein